jgi:hypothetical protein
MKTFAVLSLLLVSHMVIAAPAFTGPDLSGTYDCTGQDHQEGPYTGVVTIELVRERSTGQHGAYLFRLDVPGYGAYPGHAASRGRDMAIYFANVDPTTKDYGTGIAHFSRNKAGKWTFAKFYHGPEFKGGNFGSENCVQR